MHSTAKPVITIQSILYLLLVLITLLKGRRLMISESNLAKNIILGTKRVFELLFCCIVSLFGMDHSRFAMIYQRRIVRKLGLISKKDLSRGQVHSYGYQVV